MNAHCVIYDESWICGFVLKKYNTVLNISLSRGSYWKISLASGKRAHAYGCQIGQTD